MKFSQKIIFLLVLFLGSFYFILPSRCNFPDLPNSVKSIEPGDTTQMANISAYYTDMSRNDVLDFYTAYFSRSSFFNIPLPTYRLNHPPERIREVLRATQQSTYVEEIIHPFRESVFINGFEWNNDPFTVPERRVKNILIVDGVTYQFKVTVFCQPTSIWSRLLIFYLVLFSSCFIFILGKKHFEKWKIK